MTQSTNGNGNGPGAYAAIDYGHNEILAPLHDLEHGVAEVRRMRPGMRKRFQAQVVKALAVACRKLDAGTATQREAIDAAMDVTWWFAVEVVAGRATVAEAVRKAGGRRPPGF
jgi:hypothetical protein